MRGKRGASFIGLVAGALLILGNVLLEPQAFWMIVASVTAVTCGATSWFLWRRTPFRALAYADLLGALESAVAVVLFLTFTVEQVLGSLWFWGFAALGACCWWWGRERSRRAHPEAWERWRVAAAETGVAGYLSFRHIPRDLAGVSEG